MCCGILSSNCFSSACRFQEVNLQIFFLTYFLINRRQDVLFVCYVRGFGSLVLVSLAERKQTELCGRLQLSRSTLVTEFEMFVPIIALGYHLTVINYFQRNRNSAVLFL